MRRRALLAVAGSAALLAGLLLALRVSAPAIDNTDVTAFFEQAFPDADGTPQALSQWRGQVVVVNFWATWCAPCVEEMPELERVYRDYRERGVTVVGVGIDTAVAIRTFRDEMKLTLPLLVAGAGGSAASRDLGNVSGALPYTVLIEKDGRIGQARLGRVHEAELRRWLDARLPAAG